MDVTRGGGGGGGITCGTRRKGDFSRSLIFRQGPHDVHVCLKNIHMVPSSMLKRVEGKGRGKSH